MIPRAELAAFRFGDGLPLRPGASDDPETMVAGVTGTDSMATAYPGLTTADAIDLQVRGGEAAAKSKKNKAEDGAKDVRAIAKAGRLAVVSAARITMARALDTPSGFRERLVRFWTDHFTVRSKGRFQVLMPAAFAEEAIRPHVGGRFADMLRASTTHAAMLQYLDQAQSIGPNSKAGQRSERGLNENLAREVIELHTLGVDASYSQTDITQMAKLLTGLSLGKDGFVFRKERAEPGAETVLGKSYGGQGTDPIFAVLDDIAARPDTAHHIATKLAVHFVSDTPDPDLVATLTTTFLASGGDLPAVYRALLDHPAAWAEPRLKARQPIDFIVAALRALGLDGASLMDMPLLRFGHAALVPMAAMGQPWQQPRGPDGWPEAISAWITPQLLAARVTWAMAMPSRLVQDLPEPADMVARALGEDADSAVAWAAQRAETRAEGIGVIFASPAFNRR